MKSMWKIRTIRLALLAFGMSIAAVAQNSSQSQPDATQSPTTTPSTDTAPAPAFGQNAPILSPENPPVTGLDEPSLDLHRATRSFISPALQVSETADSNANNALGNNTTLAPVTHVIGALDLQQFWTKSDLFLEYIGGGAFYDNPYHADQLQALGLLAVTRWRTGQVALRDTFSYLPEGSFTFGFGGLPGFGLANNGFGFGMPGGSVPGLNSPNSDLGSVGTVPRLANTAIIDAVQAITPRSAITVAGGFNDAHFFDNASCAILGNLCLIDSDEVTVEGGYSHLINRHDQIGLIYAFQLYQFPQFTGGEIYVHVLNVRYSHTITGRLSLLVGGGPEYVDLEQGGNYSHWSPSVKAVLRYRFARASVFVSYERFISSGSGFYAGNQVQGVWAGFSRPLGRTWELFGDLGYTHDTPLQVAPGLGVPISSNNNGSAGAVLHKHLGRFFEFFAVYRFGESEFSVPVTQGGSTGRIGQRQVGGIGLQWHPRPTRIE